jgi:CHAD domain-containing protein
MAEPGPQRHKSASTGRTSSARTDGGPAEGMTCEAALQAVARGCLKDLKHHARAAAGGNADALHRMRIALTRLRTAIRFFATAVDRAGWKALRQQASWLGRQSGVARDIDVALQHRNRATGRNAVRWRKQRDRRYKDLRRALRSARYRRFIDGLTRKTRHADHGCRTDDQDQPSLKSFSASRLERWRRKLLTKGRKLDRLGTRKRHRLRLRAKRFKYALEWSLPVLGKKREVLRKQIEQAKLIQSALGRLNDATAHQAQAKTLRIDPLPSMTQLGRQKSQRRLVKTASAALEKLRRLEVAASADTAR